MDAMLTGGCQCGAVRYALSAMPAEPSICHCRMCQKAVGQPFAAFAGVKLDAFRWTRGTPGVWASSTAAERHFCAKCGTPLTFRYLHTDAISVAMGTLDDPNAVAPIDQYGVESRLRWVTPDLFALPAAPTDAPGTAEEVLRLTSFQHPDHDTPPDWQSPSAPAPAP